MKCKTNPEATTQDKYNTARDKPPTQHDHSEVPGAAGFSEALPGARYAFTRGGGVCAKYARLAVTLTSSPDSPLISLQMGRSVFSAGRKKQITW